MMKVIIIGCAMTGRAMADHIAPTETSLQEGPTVENVWGKTITLDRYTEDIILEEPIKVVKAQTYSIPPGYNNKNSWKGKDKSRKNFTGGRALNRMK